MSNRKPCVLYYGNALSDSVKRERCLTSRNPAGTNRMTRIASAIQQNGYDVYILSSAIEPSTCSGFRLLPRRFFRANGILTIVLRQFGIWFIGWLSAWIPAVLTIKKVGRHRDIKSIIIYNFMPDALLLAIFARLFFRLKIVVDLEESQLNPIAAAHLCHGIGISREIFYWILMRLMCLVSHGILSPSEKFAIRQYQKGRLLKITGCQCVAELNFGAWGKCVTILLSGSDNKFCGCGVLADALRVLKFTKESIRIVACGSGSFEELRRVRQQLPASVRVDILGFLTADEYMDLFKCVDICLALQDPEWIRAELKVPSKAFEAMCAGKTVIVSNISAFIDLPEEAVWKLHVYSGAGLARLLESMTMDEVMAKRKCALLYAKRHFSQDVVGKKIVTFMEEL